jgi:hypothetical protein
MAAFEYSRFMYQWDSDGNEHIVPSAIGYNNRGKVSSSGDTVDDFLEDMGQQGWELVSSHVQPESSFVCLTFKRERTD